MNILSAALRRLTYLVWRRRVGPVFARADRCRLFGLDLLVEPGILHPAHFASSQLMAATVMSVDLKGRSVADVGTGSGVLALLAARGGALVTAIDIDPRAAACAAKNVERNDLSGRINAVCSDVFDALAPDLRFDLILTNPPFYPREPADAPDRAFSSGDGGRFFHRLAEGAARRLKEDGSLVVIHSSDVNFAPIEQRFAANGLFGRVLSQKRGLFETLTIREFKKTPGQRT